MLSEIRRGLDQAGVRLADLCLSLWGIRLEVCPFVESSKLSTFCCIGDHHKMVPGDVPASGCLNSNFETRLDDYRVYRTSQIEALPHRPGGREQCTNRGKVHGGISSAPFPGEHSLGGGYCARGMAA